MFVSSFCFISFAFLPNSCSGQRNSRIDKELSGHGRDSPNVARRPDRAPDGRKTEIKEQARQQNPDFMILPKLHITDDKPTSQDRGSH
jgi:hypothetical protein